MAGPRTEEVILIENFHWVDHHSRETDVSAHERLPVHPREVWVDFDLIPAVPPAQTPFPGTPDGSGTVRGISGVALTSDPGGAPGRYVSGAGQLLDCVPAGFRGGAYLPTLRDARGAVIIYDPAVWAFDGVLGVVEFKYGVPAGVIPPFSFDYWRYVGPFAGSGGGGAVGGGANTGGGAGVYGGLVGPTMQFRSLVGGAGIDVVQDSPAAGEIEVRWSDVPATVSLFVNGATGDDVTGDGAVGTPYQTLERALQDVRATGWNDTAAITIQTSAPPFAFPISPVGIHPGGRGHQRLPLAIQGDGRTNVFAGQVVVGGALDPTSQILDVTVAGAPYSSAQLGQVVRFTSGPLSTYVWAGQPVQVEAFVTAVVAPDTLRLSFGGVAPNPGDTFVIEDLNTTVVISAFTLWGAKENRITFRNLSFSCLIGGGSSVLLLRETTMMLTGVRFVVGAGAPFTIQTDDSNIASPPLLTLTPSVLGIYIDATAAGASARIRRINPTDTSQLELAFLGARGPLQISGPCNIVSSYFEGINRLQITGAQNGLGGVWINGAVGGGGGPSRSGRGGTPTSPESGSTAPRTGGASRS